MNHGKQFLFLCTLAVASLLRGNFAIAGTLEFEASRINDSLTARDGKTVKWQFFSEGPIRYKPCVWKENVYVGSEDGHLYCLEGSTGKLVWKFFAGPSNRKMIGNERLISVWHVSGGPVAQDGKVYFAAGTWPMLGVFVYCLDAGTGKVVWLNDATAAEWQPSSYMRVNLHGHKNIESDDPEWEKGLTKYAVGSKPYAVLPKGQCEIKDGHLAVPCGRTLPAFFDLKTGTLNRKLTSTPDSKKDAPGDRLGQKEGGRKPETPEEVKKVLEFGQQRLSTRAEHASWKYQSDRVPTAKLAPDPVAGDILKRTRVANGYCVVLGIGDGKLIEGLLAESNLRLIVIDPDAAKVDSLRRKMDAAGYYGMRITALAGDPMNAGLPPYFASLMVVADPAAVSNPDFAGKIFPSLRPYGGVACLDAKVIDESTLQAQVKKASLSKAVVSKDGNIVLLRRGGALSGAGAWSHQFGSSCNTCSTSEELARAPLGVLWFGGAASDIDNVYPTIRGGHGVTPLIVGGRIVFEHDKLRKISAADVYTGQLLWHWAPPDKADWIVMEPGYEKHVSILEVLYGQPTLIGRMAATEDAVYVVSGKQFYALDAATGKALPDLKFAEQDAWKSPKVWRDQVFLASPKRLLALDRKTGKVLWSFDDFGGELAVGGDKVFCQKDVSPKAVADAAAAEAAKRRGKKDEPGPKSHSSPLVALDAQRGTKLWSKEILFNASSTRPMAYSEAHDRLFTIGGVFVGKTGDKIDRGHVLDAWTLILKDLIWGKNSNMFLGGLVNLTTDSPVVYTDPITGAVAIDAFNRGSHQGGNGCAPALACENLTTFRIDTAAYYDFRMHSGVCNVIGIRPSCTAGMIPADGLVCSLNNAACVCRYPIYTTLALMHMPEAEMWTYFPNRDPNVISKPIKQLGINFGAPGDRLAENNTLWLEYPVVGGPSPRVGITFEPEKPEWFRYHASRVKEGNGIPWVCSSGAKNLKSVTIQVNGGGPYRVREYYAESLDEKDLKLRSSVVEHRQVKASVDGKLTWTFTGKGYVCGLELIDESLAGDKKPTK